MDDPWFDSYSITEGLHLELKGVMIQLKILRSNALERDQTDNMIIILPSARRLYFFPFLVTLVYVRVHDVAQSPKQA